MRLSFDGNAHNCSADEVHCFCDSRDYSTFMICCDYCNIWYHGSCVQVSRTTAERIEKYCCPICVSKDESQQIVFKNIKKTPRKRTPRKTANTLSRGNTPKKAVSLRNSIDEICESRSIKFLESPVEQEMDDNQAPLVFLAEDDSIGKDGASSANLKATSTSSANDITQLKVAPLKICLKACVPSPSLKRDHEDNTELSPYRSNLLEYTIVSPPKTLPTSTAPQLTTSPVKDSTERKFFSSESSSEELSPISTWRRESVQIKNFLVKNSPLRSTSAANPKENLDSITMGFPRILDDTTETLSVKTSEEDNIGMAIGDVNDTGKSFQKSSEGAIESLSNSPKNTSDLQLSMEETNQTKSFSENVDTTGEKPMVFTKDGAIDGNDGGDKSKDDDDDRSDESASEELPLKEMNENVSNFLTDFRAKNKFASKLDDLLADRSSDSESENHSRKSKEDSRKKKNRLPRLSRNPANEVSPSKVHDRSKPHRRLIRVPETPEEKLLQKERNQQMVVDDEIVQQTPIGKIKRESIGGTSKLAVLLRNEESRLGGVVMGGPSTSSAVSNCSETARRRSNLPQLIPACSGNSIAGSSGTGSTRGVATGVVGSRKRGIGGQFNRPGSAKRKIFFR